jgi:hypothetical protein
MVDDKEDQFDRLEISKTVTSTPKEGQSISRMVKPSRISITVKNTGTYGCEECSGYVMT